VTVPTSHPLPRIYLCATEWIGVLQDEPNARQVEALIERANNGAYDIVASELLFIEVLAENGDELLRAGVRTWAALDHRVAMKARELRLQAQDNGHQVSRHTPDLIHIATAHVAGVEAFITTDGKCRTLAEESGLAAYDRGEFPPDELTFDEE
jgi:predicted nucleic acid-binding protein